MCICRLNNPVSVLPATDMFLTETESSYICTLLIYQLQPICNWRNNFHMDSTLLDAEKSIKKSVFARSYLDHKPKGQVTDKF